MASTLVAMAAALVAPNNQFLYIQSEQGPDPHARTPRPNLPDRPGLLQTPSELVGLH